MSIGNLLNQLIHRGDSKTNQGFIHINCVWANFVIIVLYGVGHLTTEWVSSVLVTCKLAVINTQQIRSALAGNYEAAHCQHYYNLYTGVNGTATFKDLGHMEPLAFVLLLFGIIGLLTFLIFDHLSRKDLHELTRFKKGPQQEELTGDEMANKLISNRAAIETYAPKFFKRHLIFEIVLIVVQSSFIWSMYLILGMDYLNLLSDWLHYRMGHIQYDPCEILFPVTGHCNVSEQRKVHVLDCDLHSNSALKAIMIVELNVTFALNIVGLFSLFVKLLKMNPTVRNFCFAVKANRQKYLVEHYKVAKKYSYSCVFLLELMADNVDKHAFQEFIIKRSKL